MKIRSGFVSNSSSSSFIVLGQHHRRPPAKFQEGIWVSGGDCGEGADVFELTEEMYNYIRDNIDKLEQPFNYYVGIGISDGQTINRKDLPETFDVNIFEASYHSTSCLEELQTSYFPPPESEECH